MGLLGVLPAGAAQSDSPQSRIAAHASVGEFAPAIQLARQLPTLEERDRWLAQIAEAQAGAGARDAALRTAGEISGDQARTSALSQIAAQPVGAQGGAAMADFDSLIDLITSTIQPTSWDEVGGPGSVAPFPTGVLVDTQGLMRRPLEEDRSGRLAELRKGSSPTRQREKESGVEPPHSKVVGISHEVVGHQ